MIRIVSGVWRSEKSLFSSISQHSLPEDDLLNISRNRCAKPVNCFLGNTLKKNGFLPIGICRKPGLDHGLYLDAEIASTAQLLFQGFKNSGHECCRGESSM
ncbi:hypothetical protein KIL84_018861 [Mauremys mutica]|uniref:Uncharacterized protein n=1 Tax=Mauremys mutica TaxID=74926 RepID=A0A9D3XU65_9SAUR|nr:hypothetical protein KIL84_018861 [Mauremys mutica]